jgi:hypothetical protein
LKDFMSWSTPFVSTFITESLETLAKKAALNVTIFGNFAFIVFGGTPMTPWHFRQFSSNATLPAEPSTLATTAGGGAAVTGGAAGFTSGLLATTGAGTGAVVPAFVPLGKAAAGAGFAALEGGVFVVGAFVVGVCVVVFIVVVVVVVAAATGAAAVSTGAVATGVALACVAAEIESSVA